MSAQNMPCPICAVPLAMSERQGVEIDYCPQCRGVWLDRGELDKIIARSEQEQAPPPQPAQHQAPAYQQAPPQPYHGHGKDYRQGQAYPKRRKSFFEELFD